MTTTLSPKSLARTYDVQNRSDGWEAVEDYQRYLEVSAQNPDSGSSALSSKLEMPRGRIRSWENGSKPDPVRDASASTSLLDITSTHSLRRWIQTAADRLQDETGDEGWTHLGFHDLRRTWATALASADVDALLVCDWGGWSDLETFLEHYRGTYSPGAQQRERGKVDWL